MKTPRCTPHHETTRWAGKRPPPVVIEAPEAWKVAKKIKPDQRGAIKLSRIYGVELLCVRYRESPDGSERLTTIELIVDRATIQKRHNPIVAFKIKHDELELRRLAQAKGAKYDARARLWHLERIEVLRMGLRDRIAVPYEQLLQEHVHP